MQNSESIDAVSHRRVETLEARYQHLDDRVSAMAADMSSIKTSVEGLVTAVGQLSSPRPTNWVGIGTLVLSIVIGVSQYVDLRLAPVLLEQDRAHSARDEYDKLHSRRGEIIGSALSRIDMLEEKTYHMDGLRHELESRVVELEKKSAAAHVSRMAIGDYVRDVDQLGSRRWIKGQSGGHSHQAPAPD